MNLCFVLKESARSNKSKSNKNLNHDFLLHKGTWPSKQTITGENKAHKLNYHTWSGKETAKKKFQTRSIHFSDKLKYEILIESRQVDSDLISKGLRVIDVKEHWRRNNENALNFELSLRFN